MMIAKWLSSKPSVESVRKFAIAVTVAVNIRDDLMVLKIPFLPGKGIFERAYAASEEKNKFPNTPAAVINTVLKMYLEKGTQDSPRSLNKLPKLQKVGFCTQNLGGKMNNSSSGLRDCMITYTIGKNMKKPMIARNVKIPASPPTERLRTT